MMASIKNEGPDGIALQHQKHMQHYDEHYKPWNLVFMMFTYDRRKLRHKLTLHEIG